MKAIFAALLSLFLAAPLLADETPTPTPDTTPKVLKVYIIKAHKKPKATPPGSITAEGGEMEMELEMPTDADMAKARKAIEKLGLELEDLK